MQSLKVTHPFQAYTAKYPADPGPKVLSATIFSARSVKETDHTAGEQEPIIKFKLQRSSAARIKEKSKMMLIAASNNASSSYLTSK